MLHITVTIIHLFSPKSNTYSLQTFIHYIESNNCTQMMSKSQLEVKVLKVDANNASLNTDLMHVH